MYLHKYQIFIYILCIYIFETLDHMTYDNSLSYFKSYFKIQSKSKKI